MLNIKELLESLSIKEKVALLTNLLKAPKKYENIPSLNIKELHDISKNKIFDLANISTSWDRSVVENAGVCLGQLARHSNVDVLMMPSSKVTDSSLLVKNNSISEDSYLSGKLLSKYISGVQNNTAVALKGISFDKSMNTMIDSTVNERTIKELHLKPFEIAIKEASPKFVITNDEDALVGNININREIIKPYLRNGINYKNIIVNGKFDRNDFNINNSISLEGDVDKLANAVEDYVNSVQQLENGEINQEQFDELLNSDKIVDVAIINSLLEEILSCKNEIESQQEIDPNLVNDILRRNTESSAVLMKNQYNLLPISKKRSITIIGDKSLNIHQQEIKSTFEDLTYVCGFDSTRAKAKQNIKKALKTAKKSEFVIVLLDNSSMSYTLSETQLNALEKLSKLEVKVIGVIINNNCLDTSFDKYCDALIQAHISTNAELEGLLNIISGLVNPSGKLTHTFMYEPASFIENRENKKKINKQKIGQFIGYRYFDSSYSRVNYPFGFGLSYTTFECSSLEIHDGYVALNVTNTGNVAGSEVIQVYVGKEGSNIVRVKRELKGFAKVFLQPGETKSVVIEFDEHTFTYFNEETSKFEIEGGKYNIYIATSIENILLEGVIRKYETVAPLADNDKAENYVDMNSNIISGKYTLYGNEKIKGKIKKSGVGIRVLILIALDLLMAFAMFIGILNRLRVYPFYISLIVGILLVSLFLGIDISLRKKAHEKYLQQLADDTIGSEEELPFEQLFIEKSERMVVESKQEEKVGEDLLQYYDNSLTINQVALEYKTYVNERGIALTENDAALILSALSSSNIVIFKNSNGEELDQLIEITSEYFGNKTSFESVDETFDSLDSLMWKVNENGTTIKSNFLRSIISANEKRPYISIAALKNVDLTTINDYFSEVIIAASQRTKKHFISVSNKDGSVADGNIQLRNNMWYILALKDECNVDEIDETLARNSTIIQLNLKKSVPNDTYTQVKIVNYYQFRKFIQDLKANNIISEDNYKKLDNLEEYINNIVPFNIGNKGFLNLEKFMCIYIALNNDELEALDNALASKLLPLISNVIKGKDLNEDSSLIERLEKIFGEDNIYASTRILRNN